MKVATKDNSLLNYNELINISQVKEYITNNIMDAIQPGDINQFITSGRNSVPLSINSNSDDIFPFCLSLLVKSKSLLSINISFS